MKKWLAGVAATVLTGVLVWWLTEGMHSRNYEQAPQPPQENHSKKTSPDPPVAGGPINTVAGGPINIRCTSNPHAISPGGQAEITVLAASDQNAPITGANVRIDAGGGFFSSSGGLAAVGQTDWGGNFRIIWRSPQPVGGGYPTGYGMDVSATKEGFVEGKGSCHVAIQ